MADISKHKKGDPKAVCISLIASKGKRPVYPTRLIFRGDTGYFVGALLDWLDSRGDGYLIKVKLKGLVGLLEDKKWESVAGHSGWEQAQFTHRCGTWSQTRTFVAVRRPKKDEYSRQWQQATDALGNGEYPRLCGAYGRQACVRKQTDSVENNSGSLARQALAKLAACRYDLILLP